MRRRSLSEDTTVFFGGVGSVFLEAYVGDWCAPAAAFPDLVRARSGVPRCRCTVGARPWRRSQLVSVLGVVDAA